MTVRIVRAADLVRVPWKNGGGTTAEVAAFPEGADFETFGWRISMADVASDGPFSIFPGIDRTLIVVEGNGIELEVGGVSHRLDAASPALSFSGDDRTVGKLLSGPIRDLNVMTRRGQFSHHTRMLEAGITPLSETTRTAFIVALGAGLNVAIGRKIWSLQALDTLILDQGPIHPLGGKAILIEIALAVSAREPDLSP